MAEGRTGLRHPTKDSQVGLAHQVPEANLECREFRESKANKANKASLGHGALKAYLAHKECKVPKAFQVPKARLDVTEGMEGTAGMDKMGRLEQGVIRGLKESQASQVRWGSPVKTAYRERQERQEIQELRELRESQESQDHRGCRERKVIQAIQVKRERRVIEASPANEVAEGHRVREEFPEKGDARVREVHREYRGSRYLACTVRRDDRVAST